jgi:uncharacterized protein YaaQ
MKLVFAVVNNDDSNSLNSALVKNGFMATKLCTTGGFLRKGNTTLIIGVEDEKLDQVFQILSDTCKKRKEIISAAISTSLVGFDAMPMEVVIGGATVFVLNVERFEKL